MTNHPWLSGWRIMVQSIKKSSKEGQVVISLIFSDTVRTHTGNIRVIYIGKTRKCEFYTFVYNV